MGYLTSVNSIHQWLVIRQWTIMFELDIFIHMMGHVLVAVCVEDLQAWWHSTYATSLIVSIFMRCQLSWPNSSVLWDIFIHYGDLVHYILYVAMTTCDICLLCLFMAIVLLCIQDYYTSYFLSHTKMYHCIILISGWFFHLGLHYSTSGMDIMYFGHHVTLLTSHIRGHLL